MEKQSLVASMYSVGLNEVIIRPSILLEGAGRMDEVRVSAAHASTYLCMH